jgi:hypothetical protein
MWKKNEFELRNIIRGRICTASAGSSRLPARPVVASGATPRPPFTAASVASAAVLVAAASVVAEIAVTTVCGFSIPASAAASATDLASRGSPSQVEVSTGAGLRACLARIVVGRSRI